MVWLIGSTQGELEVYSNVQIGENLLTRFRDCSQGNKRRFGLREANEIDYTNRKKQRRKPEAR